MRLKRTLKIAAVLIAVLLLAPATALVWVYTSSAGARFVLSRAVAATGGMLSIGAIDGRFSDELVLSDIRYRDARQEAEVDRLSLRLDLAGLTAGMLVVDDLRSSVVRYRTLAAGSQAQTDAGQPFSLPLTLRVDRASIEGITIERADGDLELERIVLAAAAEGTTAYLQRFEIRLLGFFLSMQGGLSWDAGLGIDGLVSWSGELGEKQWLGSAELNGRWPVFAIEQEMLEPFEQRATGSVEIGAAPAFDLAITWPSLGTFAVAGSYSPEERRLTTELAGSDLSPAAFVPDWPGRWQIGGRLSASFDDGYRLASDDLRLVASLGEQELAIALAGTFDERSVLDLHRLVATLGENRLELSGAIGSSLDLDLSARFDDLSQVAALAAEEDIQALTASAALASSLTGRAAADLNVSGTIDKPQASGSVGLAGSTFAGLPLELALDFFTSANAAQALVIERVDASLGATRVSGRGRLGAGLLASPASWVRSDAAIEVELTAMVAELGELVQLSERPEIRDWIGRDLPLTGLGGSAEASLTLDGSLRRPEASGVMRLTNLDYDRVRLTESSIDFELGLYEGGATHLEVGAAAADWSARLAAAGELSSGAWSGTVSDLALDEPWLGEWTLQSPVEVALGPDRIEIGSACLLHLDSGLCGEWRFGSGADSLTLSAREFELAVLKPLLPPSVSLEGPISLDAKLDMPSGLPVGDVSIDAGTIAVSIALSDNDSVTTTLTSVSLDAALDAYALAVRASIESSNLGRADIALATEDIRDETAPISGRLDVLWPDLSALSLLSPDVGEVGGTVALAIDVAGSAANPELSGSGTLSDGRIAVPEWALLVDRIEGEARSDEGRSLRYSGSGYVEDSEILISGVTELNPSASWPTRLRLTGENVPIARRPDATVIASPSFDIDIRLPRIDVDGTVFVPEATLAVEELPNQAVRVSPDSVVHGRTQAEEIRPLQLTALVSVELGDAVRYTGANLDMVLSGELAVEYQSGRSPIAGGSVSLDGTYLAYGQTLVLERGELLFAGPLDNPAIDVLATRTIGATTVGVRLNGNLQSPITSMYSEPAMSEANALSYLMFGRPLQSNDDEETSTLEAAAFALGVQQALPAVQRVGETLGLDELSLESTEIDAGSLMAGKYLSPKVYLSYTYGLFNRLGGFLLRYHINDRFSLETRSGSEKAMDLLYSIEKE